MEQILAIESSCDESALALFSPEKGIMGELIYSQIALHQEYGGIVPDLASREHLSRFGPLIAQMEQEHDLSQVTQIAVTCGPGLAGCLAMGVSVGKALSLAWGVPLVGVNHLRGHAFSPFIAMHGKEPIAFNAQYEALLPHLGLLVSGGNTLLFSIGKDLKLSIVAQTVDDAAGEALDKGAKLLGMEYPGGPLIEKKAQGGDRKRFDFPKSMPESKDMRFSFSGLKTSLRYRLEAMDDATLDANFPDLCASYQEAVVHQLVNKTKHALSHHQYASIGLSGGVANNGRLREAMSRLAQRQRLPLYIAEPKHTGDNAGMIAFAAWLDKVGCVHEGQSVQFYPSLQLIS